MKVKIEINFDLDIDKSNTQQYDKNRKFLTEEITKAIISSVEHHGFHDYMIDNPEYNIELTVGEKFSPLIFSIKSTPVKRVR